MSTTNRLVTHLEMRTSSFMVWTATSLSLSRVMEIIRSWDTNKNIMHGHTHVHDCLILHESIFLHIIKLLCWLSCADLYILRCEWIHLSESGDSQEHEHVCVNMAKCILYICVMCISACLCVEQVLTKNRSTSGTIIATLFQAVKDN